MKIQELWSYFSIGSAMEGTTNNEKKQIVAKQNADAYRKVHLAATVFVFVQLFFIISDLITGFYYKEEFTYLNLTAELLILLVSFGAVFALYLLKDKSSSAVRHIQFIYYMLLETGFMLYFASDVLRGLSSVSNTFYNMVILIIFATYSATYLMICTGYICVGSLALYLTCSQQFEWAQLQMLILLCILFILCAAYFRAENTKNYIAETKLETAKVLLKDMSAKDFLTKLSNRTALNSYMRHELREAMEKGEGVGLIMLDIDDFKAYNDFHSHLRGDRCLHDLGALFIRMETATCRTFRYGGEEFLVICRGGSVGETCATAARLLQGVRDCCIPREDRPGYITVSAGCAFGTPADKTDFDALLAVADTQLYAAKRAGKDCYFYGGKKGE